MTTVGADVEMRDGREDGLGDIILALAMAKLVRARLVTRKSRGGGFRDKQCL